MIKEQRKNKNLTLGWLIKSPAVSRQGRLRVKVTPEISGEKQIKLWQKAQRFALTFKQVALTQTHATHQHCFALVNLFYVKYKSIQLTIVPPNIDLIGTFQLLFFQVKNVKKINVGNKANKNELLYVRNSILVTKHPLNR